MNRRKFVAGVTMLSIATAACSSGSPAGSSSGASQVQSNEKVSLRLGIPYGGPFSPFFLGKTSGIYAEKGIDVDLQPGSGTLPVVQSLIGQVGLFAYADSAATATLIDKGLKVKIVAQLKPVTSMAVVATSASGISKPQDLPGKTLALTAGDSLSTLFPAFAAQQKVDTAAIRKENVAVTAKSSQVANGRADALLGYSEWNGAQLQHTLGKDKVKVLPWADFGFKLTDYALITSVDTIEKEPDLVRKMVAATVESWAAGHKDTAAAVAAALKANPTYDAGQAKIMMDLQKQQVRASAVPGKPMGWVDDSVWSASLKTLQQYLGLKDTTTARYYTNEFLPPFGPKTSLP